MKRLLLMLTVVPTLLMAAEPQPEETVSALWRSLSHEPGVAADTAVLERLFDAHGVVIGARYREGKPSLTATTAAEFIGQLGNARQSAFHECEVTRDVKQYDRFATVYSVVESRVDKSSARPDFVGVNSIQLYRGDDGWKIMSLYYHVEKPGLAVPLGAGKSGVCLRN